MLEWFSFTYNAARLGLEAQNAAAFRLLRFAGGITKSAADEIVPEAIATKTAADEIVPEAIAPPADTGPAPVAVAPKRRHAATRVHEKSTPVKKRAK